MQAIHVKFLGPTDTRPSRYKATCSAGSVTVSSDHSLSLSHNAARAAGMLCAKLGWTGEHYGEMTEGGLPDGSYVFVLTGQPAERYTLDGKPVKA